MDFSEQFVQAGAWYVAARGVMLVVIPMLFAIFIVKMWRTQAKRKTVLFVLNMLGTLGVAVAIIGYVFTHKGLIAAYPTEPQANEWVLMGLLAFWIAGFIGLYRQTMRWKENRRYQRLMRGPIHFRPFLVR